MVTKRTLITATTILTLALIACTIAIITTLNTQAAQAEHQACIDTALTLTDRFMC